MIRIVVAAAEIEPGGQRELVPVIARQVDCNHMRDRVRPAVA